MVIVVGYTPVRPESRAALERAIEEAQLRGRRLHVVQTVKMSAGENPKQAREWGEEVAEAQEAGDELVAQLAERGVEASFQLERATSLTAEALVGAATREGAELLVIGLRRRSPVGKLVLGSVSQDVLLTAECPVLAVKASEE